MSAIDPELFLSHMRLAAEQVGVVALQFRGKVANVGKSVEGEHEPSHRLAAEALSDVDLAAQEIILLSLAAHFPVVRLDAEEDTPLVARFAASDSRYTVVIDPIDGTLNYLSNRGQFGVLVGLLEDDRFIASLCHFPLRNETFVAVRDRGAFRYNHSEASSVPLAASRERIIAGTDSRLVYVDSATSAEAIARLNAAGYETARSGCSAVDATVAATGLAAAAVAMKQPSIRRCVGTLISREACGALTLANGEPYDCTHPRGLSSLLVSSNRETSDAVLAVVRESGASGAS